MKKQTMKKNKGERFNPYKLFHGVFIPEAIVRVPVRKLSQGSKIAYGRLCRYAGEKGEVFPRRDTLAKEVGCGVRQVDSYLNALKNFKLIESERIGLGKPNHYYFVWHEIFDEVQKDTESSRQNKAVTKEQRNENSMSQNTTTPSIKESHVKTVKEREEDAYADAFSPEIEIQTTEETVNNIFAYYQQQINDSARMTDKSGKLLVGRLSEFSSKELIKAIDNFSKNHWYMKNHSHHGIAWFFKDEDQVSQWLGLENKKIPSSVVRI